RTRSRHIRTKKMIPFDWKFPYHSQRMPVLARNVVATSQPLAAQAGLSMLMKGGNAVDAALATAITLTVVEPTGNGIGSDAFAIIWEGGKLHGLNASGASPVAWTPERFKGRTAMPATGWDSVTVPGAVSAWVALSDRFGQLPFADLFEPAIRYASDGFMVSPVIARLWARQASSLEKVPGFAEHLLVSGRGGRGIYGAGARESAQADCGDQGAGVLYRRLGGEHGGPCPQAWRRADGGRSRAAQGRLGRATRAGLSRLHVARDSPQRPGHRGADGAGHPGGVRSRGAAGRFRGQPASADRSGEARVCRRLRARFRRGHHARQKRGSPGQGISAQPRPPDRHEEGEDAAARRARARRHRVPHDRGRFRHDDFVHPVQLPGPGF